MSDILSLKALIGCNWGEFVYYFFCVCICGGDYGEHNQTYELHAHLQI